ncbi:MAG: hypothetical protein HN348_22225 [Proteobacteria bacterium]|nr:hypothetical protein [Pseudomonadota bacterium]
MRVVLPALVLSLVGCGLADYPGEPLIEAHRGAAGYWPENSRMALLESIDAGFDAIEFDLVLTADGVPVLWHDPALSPTKCTTSLFEPLEEDILLRELSFDELSEGYSCGGLPNPEHPNAVVQFQSLMSLDELLEALKHHPAVMMHLDVKVDHSQTAHRKRYASEVLERWYAADLPNSWYVSASEVETLTAFKEYGHTVGREVPTSLIVPHVGADDSEVLVGLKNQVRTVLGVDEYVALAKGADIDALAINHEIADRHGVWVANAEGLDVSLWTINDMADLRHYRKWPIKGLITDYPGDLP